MVFVNIKTMIIVSKFMVPKGYQGLTFFPFVFLKHKILKTDKVLMNHESIHLRQQIELFVVFFYLFYGLEFFIRLLYCRNWYKAYRNISFEREAYYNEANLNYLQGRPFWRFIKYMF